MAEDGVNDRRQRDAMWAVLPRTDGSFSYDAAQLAVLMDIREQLILLNKRFSCRDFLDIPSTLLEIRQSIQRSDSVKKAQL